jgi:broad specificity phosphatase PhoE
MSELEVRFIRHAKGAHMLTPDLIAGRSIDATLVDEGVNQAIAKGHELAARGVTPDYVASSSAVRCIQTGKHILSAMRLSGEFDEITDQLLEMDQGDFVGRVRKEIYTDLVLQQLTEQGKDFALEGGESMNQVGKRGMNWLRSTERLVALGNCSVLAIAHGGTITHTVGSIEDWDQERSYKMLKSMPPVGETRLGYDGRDWQLDFFAQPLQELDVT